ncbi:MAG: TIGR02679 domain-containing protein [Defluviitaleaceae bacterium]|nr:TIGR02679 domain-containing protein [Defluviitaleaceae bacterium]
MLNNFKSTINFFKKNAGFSRLLSGMFDVYVHYGRLYGAVVLEKPSREEEAALSEFFKRDYYDQAQIRISLAEFDRQLQRMSLSAVTLEDLLRELRGKIPKVVAHVPPATTAQAALEAKFFPQYTGSRAQPWLQDILRDMRRHHRPLAELYRANPQEAIDMLMKVANGVNMIEEGSARKIYMREFSRKVLGVPYGFGAGEKYGALFASALAYYFSDVDDYSRLYVSAGILHQGVLSHVMARGLAAINHGGKENMPLKAYRKTNETCVLTLENLCELAAVSTANGVAYVIEDPQVYASVTESVDIEDTIICPGNAISPAFEVLLTMLNDAGVTVFYAGRFEYRSLAFADMVAKIFGKRFRTWRYSKADYNMVMESGVYFMPEKGDPEPLHHEDLASILSAMMKTGKTGSSVSLAPLLIEDIKD